MKCIKCGTDNNLKDRTASGGRCTSCNHPFVFEPTTMTGVKVTDPRFQKAIDDLSANNTLFFTPTQLAYFLDKRLRRYVPVSKFFEYFFCGVFIIPCLLNSTFFGLSICGLIIWHQFSQSQSKRLDNRGRKASAKFIKIVGIIILMVGLLPTLFLKTSYIIFVIAVFAGIGAIYLGNRQLAQPPSGQAFLFSNKDFQGWINRWKTVNNDIPKLLPTPRQQLESTIVNSDVGAYSFDRLVVCDRAEIAQFLISNSFHFENNCAVLSITGYPESIFDTTMQMLHRNPNLKVYIVHDCSPKGMGLAQRLQSSDRWFKNRNVLMIDIGLTPRQVLSSQGIFIQTSEASAREAAQADRSQWQGLAPDEIKWLEAGNYVELESFTPQRLIQVINRGIAGSRDLSYDDGYSGSGGFISTSDSFG